MSPYGKLDPENIGLAIGLSSKSSLGAEIHAFDVLRPPASPLSVNSHSIPIYTNGKPDSKSR